ncbi:MAG TPA: hypothetical protein VG015_07060, partial [Candidatus Dormibacteraeota bacterium]|nr:hypothetical protein [Candidatus Dormibacteraeota bacterium]
MSRPRFAAAALAAFALATSGLTPAHASTPSDQAAAAQAAAQADQQQIEQLNAQIDQSNGQLKQLADQLAGLDKQLGDAEAKISALQAKLNDDQAQDDQLKAQLNQLARLSYEQQGAWLPQILGSDSLIHLWGNLATSHIVADQEQTLKLQIEVVAREDAATKKDLDATLSNLTVARAQAATLEEVTQ